MKKLVFLFCLLFAGVFASAQCNPDVTPPVFVPKPPVTIACPTGIVYVGISPSGIITIPNIKAYYQATDNCDSSVTITQSPAAGTVYTNVVVGQTWLITITATDDANNFTNCYRTLKAR